MAEDRIEQARQHLENLKNSLDEVDDFLREDFGRNALENLKGLRTDIYNEEDFTALEAVTNHVITDKNPLIGIIDKFSFFPQAKVFASVKEGACEQVLDMCVWCAHTHTHTHTFTHTHIHTHTHA
jgi:hypothetical protein